MKKRTAFTLLTLALLLCLCPVVAAGTGGDDELPEIPVDGNKQKCGDDLYWSFNSSTGTLTITGSGAMDDYASLDDQPWAAVRDQIKKISLPERLQDIGTWAFSGCRGLTSITIPHGVTHIYGNAFRDCDVLTEVQYDGTTLYIYGASTENGRKYELNADRLYINDKEYGPVGTTNLNEWTGEDGYTFTTDLSALHLEDDFTVTLPLSIYQGEERFQNQELSFTMSAKANIQKAEDQTFAHDGFTIYVTNIVRTTNVVRFSVRYQLTEEEREKLDETNTGLTSVISGDEVEDGQNGFTSGYEVEDGYVEEHIHAGISPDLDQIALQTLLVENGGYVRDGKVIAEDMIRLNE